MHHNFVLSLIPSKPSRTRSLQPGMNNTSLVRFLSLGIVFISVAGHRLQIKQAISIHKSNPIRLPYVAHSVLGCRGGSTTEVDQEEVEVLDTAELQDENQESQDDTLPSVSSQPMKILIKTNFRNSVLDEKVELMAARTRDVSSLKKSLSRLLPGRPPILGLQLLHEGRILDDDELVDELLDGEDEDEEMDSEEENAIVLVLNSIPPVNPKFATELAPQLKSHLEGDDDTLTTEELIDAYFLNQASIMNNAQLLAHPSQPVHSSFTFDLMEQAEEMKAQMKSQTKEEDWEASLQPVRKRHNLEERRGQRYRSGKGGARTNLKKSIQTNMNIVSDMKDFVVHLFPILMFLWQNWGETIRNFLLFLFFGFFGGRNTLSRSLMLWGAPLCFLVQARPVKMWTKVLFYMMANPPGIVLSLLPAPQQAILNANDARSFTILYSTEVEMGSRDRDQEILDLVTEEEDDDNDLEERDSDDEDDEDETSDASSDEDDEES